MACLVCGVTNCVYNEAQYCSKGDIMVGGKHACKEDETCCESFRDNSKETMKSSLEHPSSMIHIDCEVEHCVYNANYRCQAENVTIKGNGAANSKETLCSTFKEKNKEK